MQKKDENQSRGLGNCWNFEIILKLVRSAQNRAMFVIESCQSQLNIEKHTIANVASSKISMKPLYRWTSTSSMPSNLEI